MGTLLIIGYAQYNHQLIRLSCYSLIYKLDILYIICIFGNQPLRIQSTSLILLVINPHIDFQAKMLSRSNLHMPCKARINLHLNRHPYEVGMFEG